MRNFKEYYSHLIPILKMLMVTFFEHHMEQTVGYPCLRSDEYLATGNKTEHEAYRALALFLSWEVANPPSQISQL